MLVGLLFVTTKRGIYVVDADGVADTAPKDKIEDMDVEG